MKVSPAEMLVMECLWDRSPQTAEDLVSTLGPEHDWSEATIRTLVSRLIKKGLVVASTPDRRYAYSPVMSRAEYGAAESESLIDRMFAGELTPMVTHFTRRRPLSPDDLAALKRLVKDLEEGR